MSKEKNQFVGLSVTNIILKMVRQVYIFKDFYCSLCCFFTNSIDFDLELHVLAVKQKVLLWKSERNSHIIDWDIQCHFLCNEKINLQLKYDKTIHQIWHKRYQQIILYRFKLMFQDYFGFSVLKQKHHHRTSSSVLRRTELSCEKLNSYRSKSNSRGSAVSLRKSSYDELDFIKSTNSNIKNARNYGQTNDNKIFQRSQGRRSLSGKSTKSQFNCFTNRKNCKPNNQATEHIYQQKNGLKGWKVPRQNAKNSQASEKQNYIPYQTRQQYSNQPISRSYYRGDGLKQINNYHFRMKQYYHYNDQGDYLSPNKNMKANMEQKLRAKYKLAEQKSNNSQKKSAKGVQLFQESKVKTQSQYYVMQRPTSQKQQKKEYSSTQNAPQQNQQRFQQIGSKSISKHMQRSLKHSKISSKGCESIKNSRISQANIDQYQLQINTKINPSTGVIKKQSINTHKQIFQGRQSRNGNQWQKNSISFRKQQMSGKVDKSLSQSKKSLKSKNQNGSFFIYGQSVSGIQINKQNSDLNIQFTLHTPSQANNRNNSAAILSNLGQSLCLEKKQNRKSIMKNKNSQRQQINTIKQERNDYRNKSSVSKCFQQYPIEIVQSKNYLSLPNSQSRKKNQSRISEDQISKYEIKPNSKNQKQPSQIAQIKKQGKLPIRSRFSISQTMQRWSFGNKQNKQIINELNKNSLPQQILRKINLHLTALNLMAQFIIMTEEIYDEEQSDWTKIPSFIIYKKFLAERIKVVNNLKGNFEKGSCFNIQDAQITIQMLKDYAKDYPKDQKMHQKMLQIQSVNFQIRDSIDRYYEYLMQEKQKYISPLLNLQPFDDHYVGLLMVQLNGQFEALQPKLQEFNQGQNSDEVQIIIERLYRIMQLVFLLSELQGRRVKKYEEEFQVNAFQEYYQQNYPLYRQTVLYFN